MTDQADVKRSKYFEEYSDRVDRHRARQAEYDKHAIEFASSAMRAVTYLNGGALVAIPAAVALFQTNLAKAKVALIVAGLLFVVGLLLIVLAQACAFFVEARRADAELQLADAQENLLDAVHYPGTAEEEKQRTDAVKNCRQQHSEKWTSSNRWRTYGLVCFGLAVILFIAGSGLGAWTILK